MGSYRIAGTGRIVSMPPTSETAQRGVIELRSDSTGLYGGEDTEMEINGKIQRFDWEKAMLLVKPTPATQ